MWWIARSLELLQDFQEFAKLLFTNPVKAFQFLVDLILFDWPTHMLQLATWLAENPQLLVAALTPAISGLGAVSGLAGLTGLVPQPPSCPRRHPMRSCPPCCHSPGRPRRLPRRPAPRPPERRPGPGRYRHCHIGVGANERRRLSPYLVGSGPGIDFDAGTPAGSRRAQPAADNVTAVAAAQVSARHQARRRRRAAAKERGNADEFVDMDSGPAIPPSASGTLGRPPGRGRAGVCRHRKQRDGGSAGRIDHAGRR